MFSFFKSKKFFFAVLLSGALIIEVAILYYFFISVPGKLPIKPPEKYLLEVQEDKIPRFTYSNKDFEELKEAFDREEKFLSQKIAYKRKLAFGKKKLPASLIKESSQLLLQTLQKVKTEEELNRLIRKQFTVYQAVGEKGEVLFTAYYSPIYEGSLKKHGPYQCPLYSKPEDLKIANLGEFDPALEEKRIVYRIEPSSEEIAPYWTRKDIVQGKVLEGEGLEFIYLKNKIDRFFLMIEGAGKIVLDNGESFWVNYVADNGRGYTSLGGLLVKDGKLSPGELTKEGIIAYFKAHPEQIDKYLYKNQRFIFYKEDQDGPYGAGEVKLTPFRSLAVDENIFPLGALAYIEYPEPKINREGEVGGIKKTVRFVFCQDTGEAIKGPGRADIYFGEGEKALAKVGHLKGKGKLYFLIKK